MQDSTSTTVIHVKMSKNKLMLCVVSRQLTSHSALVHRLFESDSMNYGTVNVVLEHANKAQRGGRCMAPPILNFSTNQRSIVSLTPHPLYPSERAPGSYFIGAWEGPRSNLDVLEKKQEISCSCQDLNPRSSIP